MISRFSGPMGGLRVIVTRAHHQIGGLAMALRDAGAEVVNLPLLEILPPADPRPLQKAARRIGDYDWVVLTSTNAVDALLKETRLELPPEVSVATVGGATADRLKQLSGRTADIEARRSDAVGLAAELLETLGGRRRVLLPQAGDARPILADTLAGAGVALTTVVAYDKGLPPGAAERAGDLFRGMPVGWVTFTSSRIVRHFVDILGKGWARRKKELFAASIGPVTSSALREAGVEPAVEAERPDDRLLADAILHAVVERGLVPKQRPGKSGKTELAARDSLSARSILDDFDWDNLLR